ncbi:protein chromatin remodeling 24 isoform X2 [Tanacetum coccineum]|uniref:Protein chromatin remodeling 24 isoform X2 n=1 Tax=Tanacetum coccineum TaxID=301880 RepID=A0ABQ5EJ01_9ASTR
MSLLCQELWALFSYCAPNVLGNIRCFEPFNSFHQRGIDIFHTPLVKRIERFEAAIEKRSTIKAKKLPLYKSIHKSDIFSAAHRSVTFSALTILRKICGHPTLTQLSEEKKKKGTSGNSDDHCKLLARKMDALTTKYAAKHRSSKIKFIKSLVVDLVKEKHHVLIFSQWKEMVDLIQASLEKKDVTCLRMDGSHSVEERDSLIKFLNTHSTTMG